MGSTTWTRAEDAPDGLGSDDPWTVVPHRLPWTPVAADAVMEWGLTIAPGSPAPANDRNLIDPELVLSLAILVVAGAAGVVELALAAAAWPGWWLWHRMRHGGRPLRITDPRGRPVPMPTDLRGRPIEEQRAELGRRIAAGRLTADVPEQDPGSWGLPDQRATSCAGPGQPLIRRSRPVRSFPPAERAGPGPG